MAHRILLVDDNETVRHTIASMLESKGFTVCGQAVDGAEAVHKAVELRPDLIIIDLVMPSMNGLIASREISKLLPGLPILLHTLHATPELELEAKKHGVSRLVPKSEGYSLGSHVQAILDSSRGSTTSSAGVQPELPSGPTQAIDSVGGSKRQSDDPNRMPKVS